jgi:hypothetical protein
MPTYEESKAEYQQKMGKELGSAYHLLWNLCARLHIKWTYYCELFGKDQVAFDVMNAVAPALFKTFHDTLWESILLDIAKFCDPIRVGVGKPLSLALLSSFVAPGEVSQFNEYLERVKVTTAFARDWRNRHIAHWDYAHASEGSARPLAPASRAAVREALQAIACALEAVESHFTGASLIFDGSKSEPRFLLSELALIQRLRDERDVRLRDGTATPDDMDWGKWH